MGLQRPARETEQAPSSGSQRAEAGIRVSLGCCSWYPGSNQLSPHHWPQGSGCIVSGPPPALLSVNTEVVPTQPFPAFQSPGLASATTMITSRDLHLLALQTGPHAPSTPSALTYPGPHQGLVIKTRKSSFHFQANVSLLPCRSDVTSKNPS